MKTILQTTDDGSHTLYVPELDEHYHSTHGAIQESMHVFIDAGLRHCTSEEINLLEIGFGTAECFPHPARGGEIAEENPLYHTRALSRRYFKRDNAQFQRYPRSFTERFLRTASHVPLEEWVQVTPFFG